MTTPAATNTADTPTPESFKTLLGNLTVQLAGDAHSARGMSGRFITQIRRTNEGRE